MEHIDLYVYGLGVVCTIVGGIITWYHYHVVDKFEALEKKQDAHKEKCIDDKKEIDDRINVVERRQAVYESKLTGFDKKLDEVAADIKTLLGMHKRG